MIEFPLRGDETRSQAVHRDFPMGVHHGSGGRPYSRLWDDLPVVDTLIDELHDWIVGHGFSYTLVADMKANYSLGFEDRRAAMMFKLRWHDRHQDIR